MVVNVSELFDQPLVFPDPDALDRWGRLVGIDQQKERLTRMLSVLVNPAGIEAWAKTHHPGSETALNTVLARPPLVVLAGDVGCGKTELAESVGDAVARQEGIDVTLYPLSLSTRGEGRVGEMTRLLSNAFTFTLESAKKLKATSGKARGAVLLLVDEADAIAQSREHQQMHHEDRAGVNAFIRGVDLIARGRLPAAVILCTNRLNALDPAVRRRAADVLAFERPNDVQRGVALQGLLSAFGMNDNGMKALVTATGPNKTRDHGFTFSDLLQRLVPAIVLDAYPNEPVSAQRAIEIATEMVPTPPFQG